jgi:hypothetical protein
MTDFITYLWVEGISPPFPSENATDAELAEFLRRCEPAPGLITSLPKTDWEVSEFPQLDLHIVKIPYRAHTYSQPYLQRNTYSERLRIVITFRGYQARDLGFVYNNVKNASNGQLYEQAKKVAKYSKSVFELQKNVEKAKQQLDTFLDSLLKGPESILGATFQGRIAAAGGHVAILLPTLNEDRLLDLARKYVAEKNLGWHISKPYSWSEKHSGPHVTIDDKFRANVGQDVPVTLEMVYSFISESRWVAIAVRLPAEFKCAYECHLSIGQERQPWQK